MHPDFLPLAPQEWDASLDTVREALGTPLHIHGLLARNPALLAAWAPFREHVVRASALSPLVREVVILRVAYLIHVDYEWVHHVDRGRRCGVDGPLLDKIRAGTDEDDSTLHAVLQAVTELCSCFTLSPASIDQLTAALGADGTLDLTATVGAYLTLGMFLLTFEIELEKP